jgi:hypothetical protein
MCHSPSSFKGPVPTRYCASFWCVADLYQGVTVFFKLRIGIFGIRATSRHATAFFAIHPYESCFSATLFIR